MEWKEHAKTLKELLKLKGSPVAVTYSMKAGENPRGEGVWVCRALLDARDGQTLCMGKANSGCPGGAWHLGLAPKPTGPADTALKEFLVHGEKLFCSFCAFYREMSLTADPPLGLADYVIFSPLEEAKEKPDLVVFICSPEQGCRLITLAQYATGIPPRTEMAGSTCHMAVAYPIVSGEINVSLLDYTSRRMQRYGEDELMVSVPYHYMSHIVESIETCSAGRARVEGLKELQKAMEQR